MTNNAFELKRYFEETQDTTISFEDTENGNSFAILYQTIKCGIRVEIELFFSKGDDLVRISMRNYVAIPDGIMKEEIYKLLNDLNKDYTVLKFFIIDGNEITIEVNTYFNDNFSPKVVMDMVFMVLHTADTEYARIMKTIWA